MTLLSPVLLLFGLITLPILALYMLKLRRRDMVVSSTMLWQALLRDRQANSPWQRLKRNILLILQLLTLAGMVLALSRPALFVPAVARGSLVILLDASASMAATDVKPNRFQAAKDAAWSLISSLDNSSQVTLIQVAGQPHILATREHDLKILSDALNQAKVSTETGNWQTAFSVAAGAINTAEPSSNTLVIISDGGIPSQDLPPLPAQLSYIPIGKSGNNLAISALALRPSGNGSELFASITNYDSQEREVIFSVYRDDVLFNAQVLTIPANYSQGVSLPNFPAGESIVTAKLSQIQEGQSANPVDDFQLDDIAFSVNQASSNQRVLLVSAGNFFLDQFFAALPNVKAFKALPILDENGEETSRFQLPNESFDLYVLDRTLTTTGALNIPELPLGNLLLIDPPSNALFPVTGVFSPTTDMEVREQNLTKDIDWNNVHIQQAQIVRLPPWAEVLVDSPEGPLIFTGESQGRRIAVLTFDLHNSDLPLQIAFPVLFANLVNYLIPAQTVQVENGIRPGDGIEIHPPPGTETVAIASPSGEVFTLTPTESGFFFTNTHELGIYAVNFLANDHQSHEYFAVNLFDPGESAIHPASSIQVGHVSVPAARQGEPGRMEIWNWLVGFALAILLVEWWAYHKSSSQPGKGLFASFFKKFPALNRKVN